jgi:hypothetical protein
LALGVIHERPAWPWFWVSTCSIGTYLFYIDGPYWLWINLGWGGGVLLALWWYRDALKSVAAEVRTAVETQLVPLLDFRDVQPDA